MRVLKILGKTLAVLIVVAVIVVGGYVGYVALQYYRIEDNFALSVESNVGEGEKVALGQDYTVTTYNIGFGAYTHEFSFFMDSGTMKDGAVVTGSDSVAKDRETVERNTNGALDAVARLNPDFMFFQEVDEDGDRSHHFNQVQAVKDKFRTDGVVYAENFHTAYLFYPLNKPHGKNNAGIVTVTSKYASSAVRRSFPVDNGFINKFFDLDRCFSITYLPVEGSDNYLCLVNVHMSAYDKGGVIRHQQLQMLNEVLAAEVEAGNYVVAGGDFNHDIAGSDGLFPTEMERPEWVYSLGDDDLADGLRFVAATNAPTCRSTDIPYTKGVNYTVVLDGFIVSDNVEAVDVTNIDLDFEFSDHNPAMMTFRLK